MPLYDPRHFWLAVAISGCLFFSSSSIVTAGPASAAVIPALPSDTPGKIEVLEFFSYSCGPCAKMETQMADWAKTIPPNAVLKRVPIAFNAGMRPMQQFYYTLLAIDRPDLHPAFFAAIHQERKRLFDRQSMTEWAVAQGVDRFQFEAAFDSFAVQVQVRRASQLAESYRLAGTPSFAVGGKYMTSPAMAGSNELTIREVERLIPLAQH